MSKKNRNFNIKVVLWWEDGVETHISHEAVQEIIKALEKNRIIYKIKIMRYMVGGKMLGITFNINKDDFNKYKINLNKIKSSLSRNAVFIHDLFINGEEKNIMDAFIDIFLSMDGYEIYVSDWKYKSEMGMDKEFKITRTKDNQLKYVDIYYDMNGNNGKEYHERVISLEEAKLLMREYPDWTISHPF